MTRFIVLFGLFFLVNTTAVSAQTADYTEHMRTAISLNQQLVQQIVVAQSTTDVAVLGTQAAVAYATAQELAQRLNDALGLATSDSDRSRVSGLLDHTLPVIADLERAQQETSFDVAQGRLNQAWGEANEALSEILPTVPPAQPSVPAELPNTGNLDSPALASLPLFGGLLVVAGVLLRFVSRSRARIVVRVRNGGSA